MSEEPANYNSQKQTCEQKDIDSNQTETGSMTPMLIWIPTQVVSTANLREHWTKSSERKQQQKAAVKNAVANLQPPKVPDANEDI